MATEHDQCTAAYLTPNNTLQAAAAFAEAAAAVNVLKEGDKGLLLITHYQRLLDAIHPDFVHVMQKGKIVQTGDVSIAAKLEEGGFEALTAK